MAFVDPQYVFDTKVVRGMSYLAMMFGGKVSFDFSDHGNFIINYRGPNEYKFAVAAQKYFERMGGTLDAPERLEKDSDGDISCRGGCGNGVVRP